MPALPWTTLRTPDPDIEVLVMGSRLRLRRHRSTLRFARATSRIRHQLAHTEGLVGYALDAHVLGKTYWTVSAWVDGRALGAFNHAEPHEGTRGAIGPAIVEPRFVTWRVRAGDLPIRFDEVRRRITEANSS